MLLLDDGVVTLFHHTRHVIGVLCTVLHMYSNPACFTRVQSLFSNYVAMYVVSTVDFAACLQEYPGEELLLVYDHEYKYGENFYICLTEEAKELVLNVCCMLHAIRFSMSP